MLYYRKMDEILFFKLILLLHFKTQQAKSQGHELQRQAQTCLISAQSYNVKPFQEMLRSTQSRAFHTENLSKPCVRMGEVLLGQTLCNVRNLLFSWLSPAEQCVRGLMCFLKVPSLPKPPFHLTQVIWNIFSFKVGLWLKTKGRLSQRADFLPPAFEKRSQPIMVNNCTKASARAYAGQLASKHWSTMWRTTKCCDACRHNKCRRSVSALCSPASVPSALFLSFYHQSAVERETLDTWLISKEGGPLACDISDASFFSCSRLILSHRRRENYIYN